MYPVMNKNYQTSINLIVKKHLAYLSSTPRYERYMVDESLNEWVRLLGPDVSLLTHADATAVITKKFVTYNEKHGLKLNRIEKDRMLLAPWIHDWGEIIIDGKGIGDITYDKKTAADVVIETAIFNKVISAIPIEKVKEEFHITYQDVVLKKNQKLGDMFNTIERIGYMETAITAFVGRNGNKITNWKGLSGSVLSNHSEKLIHLSEICPYVSYFLKQNRQTMHKMFEVITRLSQSPVDNTNTLSFDVAKLRNAYASWLKK